MVTRKRLGKHFRGAENEIYSTIRSPFGFLLGSQLLVDAAESGWELSSGAQMLYPHFRVMVHPPALSAILPAAGGAAHHMRLNSASDDVATNGQPLQRLIFGEWMSIVPGGYHIPAAGKITPLQT
jgi:hypothetical protein